MKTKNTPLRELSSERLSPRYAWQKWTRDNLPNSNLFITDIDNILRYKTGEIILLEIKSQGQKVYNNQAVTLSILNKALASLQGQTLLLTIGDIQVTQKIDYKGLYIVTFTGEEGDFSQPVYLNKEKVTEYELRSFLDFSKDF